MSAAPLNLDDIRRCIEGHVPPIMATASASGVPNVVFISSINVVDGERIALSNQFMGKSATNLAENPHASLVLIDPHTGSDFRLTIVYERTERRGPVFERLKAEVDQAAKSTGTEAVFRLRSADIYRIERIDVVNDYTELGVLFEHPSPAVLLEALGELTRRLSRCADLDTIVAAAVRGLDDLLGYERSTVMLVDEAGERLFTIASHGFDTEGVGSELPLGQEAAGVAAERNRTVRLGGVHAVSQYGASIGTAYAAEDREIPVPTSAATRSRLAVPAVSRGEVLGVVVVESSQSAAFDATDESVVGVVASLIADMIERSKFDGVEDAVAQPVAAPESERGALPVPSDRTTHVRFFPSDGSVFLDGEYLIRGVAGRVLWSMARRHEQTGQDEFTTKELRLDKSLELPGYRDNLDTRIILLKRRLDEREAPIRLARIGRGRVALHLSGTLNLEAND